MSREIENAHRLTRNRNDHLDRTGSECAGRWVADSNGSLSLMPKDRIDRSRQPQCTADQAAEIMAEFGIKSSIISAVSEKL